MHLAELKSGLALVGLEPEFICTVVAVVPITEGAVQVVYRLPDGTMKERLLGTADEATISQATTERPWAFDGDAAAFQLACEAKRIDLAFLFDPMMAIHTSNVDPLPHQITAVYESMLPRQPLRFVLADDPGAGKTIMAGLYIRELVMRADARRILIVAPGSLVEQWRDELYEKFGLEFRIFSSALEEASPSGNPFEDHQQIILIVTARGRSTSPAPFSTRPVKRGWRSTRRSARAAEGFRGHRPSPNCFIDAGEFATTSRSRNSLSRRSSSGRMPTSHATIFGRPHRVGRLKAIAPEKIYRASLGMNAALAAFWSRELGDATQVVPFKVAGHSEVGGRRPRRPAAWQRHGPRRPHARTRRLRRHVRASTDQRPAETLL